MTVATAWSPPYSWLHNTISDLGNTVCGPYGDRLVCSPGYAYMNGSLILLGITMMIGAALIYHELHKNFGTMIGFLCMALAGFGTLLVGLYPENTVGRLHFVGALLPFLVGNMGIVMLGLTLDIPRWLRIYSVATGGVALIALVLFITQTYLGLGIGGMERIVAYPQTVWLIVFGLYAFRNHYRTA